MKRLGKLWPRVIGFDNLLLAWRKARRGKSHSPDVIRFGLELEKNLLGLQAELQDGRYQPGGYRLFEIYERKRRVIAAAPFRDRVVHHALMNVIGPPLEAGFIDDCYACRPGKGTHAAVARYQHWARRYAYALKMDVQQYFPSIDHAILKDKLSRRIKDRYVLALLDLIIDTSPVSTPVLCYFEGDDLFTPLRRPTGIPIGNLTSQFFANLYLDDMDHYLQEKLRLRAYLRYTDDFVVMHDDKRFLAEVREQVREYLLGERLMLHPKKAHITPTRIGLDFLGNTVYPYRRHLRNDNGHRFVRKLRGFAKAYAKGEMDWPDFDPSVQGWIGHVQHADTQRLREVAFDQISSSDLIKGHKLSIFKS